MKKIFTVMVLALFILSIVPVALADQGEGKSMEKQFIAAKEKIQQAKDNVMYAKERYNQAKENFEEHKGVVLEAKERVQQCKEGEEEQCQELRKELRIGVRNHLGKTNELISRSIEDLADKIEKSNILTEEEKTAALAKFDELKSELTALLDKTKGLSDDVTAEELKEKTTQLKELWQDVKKEERWQITQLINNKMGNIVSKHDEYYNAMELRIANLKEKGASEEQVAELEDILGDFKEELIDLKKLQIEADVAWKEVKSNPEAITKAKQKHDDLKEELEKTRDLLRKFMEQYREVKQSMNVVEETAESDTVVDESGLEEVDA